MIDFIEFNDDICIYGSELDEWGLPKATATDGVKGKGFIREQIEQMELKNQKGANIVISYTVTLSNSTQLENTDLIGIMVDGSLKKFEILKLQRCRDLSGEPIFLKVWI